LTRSEIRRQSRGRLLPYYLYVATVATALLPVGAMWLNREAVGALQLALLIAAVHSLVVAGMLVANWRGMVRQLRGISRIQFRRWAWCRMVGMIIYRDSDAWWRTVAVLVFVPAGLIYLIMAYAID
jgi:hypothetical protein